MYKDFPHHNYILADSVVHTRSGDLLSSPLRLDPVLYSCLPSSDCQYFIGNGIR